MRALNRLLAASAVVVAGLGACWAKDRADIAALAAAGYRPGRDGPPQAYFTRCAREGAPPAVVARCMPAGASLERYVAPFGGGPDSALLERYVYHAAGPFGRWPVFVYYRRGGGVWDVYAQDAWPGLAGARPV